MFKRLFFGLSLAVFLGSAMATVISFEELPSGPHGQQLFADQVLFSTSSSNTLSIRADCGTPGQCLASVPSDVLYGWLVVQLPTPVYGASFDFYASDAKLWIAGHHGSAGIDATVTEEYFPPGYWWNHTTLQSSEPFDFVTFTTVTNDRVFSSHPSIWIDNLTFSSPVPEPSTLLLLISGLAALNVRQKRAG